MVVLLIFIVWFIVMVLLLRSDVGKNKKCHSKKSAAKEAMDEKNKKTAHFTPHTQRNASGRNWEIYKNIMFNSSPLATNSNKGNMKKKTNVNHSDTRRKSDIPNRASLEEEQVYDEDKKKLTKQVAMDCEMVGIGNGTESMLARVSVVNRYGYCVYDKYVKPREQVQDYRTQVSGIRPHHLETGEEFNVVQKEIAEILKGRVLIGHALKHDLDVLYLSHPYKHLRDTSRFKIFRQLSSGKTPSLKKLVHELLGKDIQIGEHSSVEDARAAMQLYVLYKNKWESELYSNR